MISQHLFMPSLKLSSGLNISKYLGVLPPKFRQFHRQVNRTTSLTHGITDVQILCDFSSISRHALSPPPIGSILQPLVLSKRNLSKAQSPEEKGHMVYMGRVRKMFKTLKIFSLTTSALGISFQPYLWYSAQDLSLLATVPLFASINVFLLLNPILIHQLSKRYVNELYFNPKSKEFTAFVLTFFARKEVLTFTANDVEVPDVPGMFSMLNVKDRPLFIDERDFMNMEVYKHLMGFDRPLDLRDISNPSRQDDERTE